MATISNAIFPLCKSSARSIGEKNGEGTPLAALTYQIMLQLVDSNRPERAIAVRSNDSRDITGCGSLPGLAQIRRHDNRSEVVSIRDDSSHVRENRHPRNILQLEAPFSDRITFKFPLLHLQRVPPHFRISAPVHTAINRRTFPLHKIHLFSIVPRGRCKIWRKKSPHFNQSI